MAVLDYMEEDVEIKWQGNSWRNAQTAELSSICVSDSLLTSTEKGRGKQKRVGTDMEEVKSVVWRLNLWAEGRGGRHAACPYATWLQYGQKGNNCGWRWHPCKAWHTCSLAAVLREAGCNLGAKERVNWLGWCGGKHAAYFVATWL